MGAFDYVVKLFSSTEFSARTRVALVGRRVQLTPTEYEMLADLLAHAGRVLTHEHLLERVWSGRGGGNMRPMRTIVSMFRRNQGDYGNLTYIFTEPRVGFRMSRGEENEQ